jgi:nitroimidazol reductase NimA-like FMN-containing flavoprotein (pyridoxamine 5'-phosphate oxidase superfamily)
MQEVEMSEELKGRIRDYLGKRLYINLGTVDGDAKPLVHTVGFAVDGDAVVIVTDKRTRKAGNIEANPAVSFTADEDEPELMKIMGVQVSGTATQIKDEAEIGRVMGLLVAKYPHLKELPPNEFYVTYRISFEKGVLIDNSKGFGHREEASY